MKTCKDCKHYDSDPDLRGLVYCRRINMMWDCYDWNSDASDYVLKEKYKEDRAFVQDGSDYSAALLVFPDFYCYHLEE